MMIFIFFNQIIISQISLQVVDTLSPLCKSANMNDTIRLANELHHFLDWDQIESEVSCKKLIT